MQAKATRTLLVAWDGVHAEQLDEGTILEGERAAHAVEQGFAEPVGEKDAGPAPRTQAAKAAPRNKAKE